MKARLGVARALVALSLGLAGIALFCLAWHEGGRETDRDGEGLEEREARGDSPDEALRFRRLQLQDEHGVIPTDGLRKARQQMAVMKDARERKARAFGKGGETDVAGIKPGQWEWLGPGNVGGRIRSIVIDPANANKMWVGSVSGGIWSSSDAGGSWLPVNDFAANLAVSTMVIDPTNSSVMYAGTGESFAASLSAEGQGFTPEGLRGDGVFKSSDGGVTWNQLPSTDSTNPAVCAAGGGTACPWSYVNRLAMSPDGSTILAATIAGIYRSTDGGATWTPAPSATGIFLDIDFDPTNSQNAIAGATGGAPSVFSTNGGQSWQRATYNPPIAPNGSSGRIELAYAPSNPAIVYASIDVTRTPPAPAAAVMGDIYQSTDGGQTYTLLNTINPGNTFLGLQGSYGNIIWVNPQNPNFVIVGGINLYRSTDGGINWSGIANGGNGSAHSDHHMIVAAPGFNNTANKTVYFSNDGGIYRADDVSTVSLTSGWTKLNNSLGITQFYGAAANAAGVIVGGTQDNGTVRYSGNLQSWTTMFGGDGGYAAADPTDNNYFFGEYINLGILRSTDGGNSSGYIYCNPVPTLPNGQPNPNGGPCTGTGIMDAFNGANFIAPFLLDPNNPNTMLAGGLSLWRSNDIKASGLPTWTAIKSPASNGLIPASNVPISAIAVAANNSNFIVVGHNDGQIYLTSDGTGATPPTSPSWSRISNGTPARFVTRVVIDQTKSPNWIYATFGGFTTDNIYRTTDLGVTWTDVTGTGATGLPNVPVRSLAISPANANYLYAGTEVGIFASEDGGATWGLPQDGPANVSVDDLFWLSGKLVAVTHGRGLYKSNMPVYNFTVCNPPPNCGCFGDWDCPCSWNSGQVPTINDDVAVVCPITVQQAANVRNLTVNNNFLLNGTLTVAQDIVNYGKISSSPGVQTSISCRNLTNSRPPDSVSSLAGVISLLGGISASGDVTNGGIIALGTTLTSNNLTTTPGSTLTLSAAHVGGNLLNGGAIETQGAQGTINVKRDIVNRGSLKGAFLALTTPGGVVRKLSGSGVWNFSALGIPSGYTAELNSDVTFDIAGFSNNGTLNYRNNTLNFNGSSFGGNGAAAGTGTLRFTPTGGSAIFNGNGPAVTIASGTVEYQSGGTISGPFTIDNGATFAMNTSGILTVNNDVTINGSLVKTGGNPEFVFNGLTFINNGSFSGVDFLTFNDSGAPNSQLIAGFGAWSPTNVQIGGSSLSTAFVTLQNDVTLASNQLFTSTGSTLSVGNHTLTMTGPTGFFGGKISGTGLVKMLPSSGTPRLGGPFFSLSIDPDLEIASGTVKATRTIVGGKLTVDAGATLSLFGSTGIETNGDVMNNGTLNAFSDGPSLNFKGDTFTNRGAVTGNVYVNLGVNLASPRAQKLAGTGSWTASPRLFIDALSSTTLLNDVTYDGGNLFVEGKINTGAFTLSLPCAVSWSGAGEVVGNIRRTNLAACPGAAIAYGNPFTTIAFNSGTPPTEINVNVALSAPPGFANAVRRTYKITPTGGSDFTATLRLRYLDSELNGNDEATLQLLRQDGIGWSPQGATGRDTANNWVENANVTRFSTWTLSSLAPPPLPTTFANWRQGFFTTQELGDAAISGELADPDNDGVSNLLEYAFHFDPKDPSSANRPYGMKEGAYFSLIYTRTLAATDLTYIVEGSSGLSGAWPAVNPTNTILADDGVTQTVKAQVPVTEPQTFLRLRVSH